MAAVIVSLFNRKQVQAAGAQGGREGRRLVVPLTPQLIL